ncbi:ATP-binding protein [Streptomyces xanthophaeus]
MSELVSNAIRHTDGPCTLHLALQGDHIHTAVTDTSPDPPQPRPPHTDGTGGWGWILINHLTTDVHIEPTPGGSKPSTPTFPGNGEWPPTGAVEARRPRRTGRRGGRCHSQATPSPSRSRCEPYPASPRRIGAAPASRTAVQFR